MVIECKNETTTEAISKHDCNQLNGSINWLDDNYPEGNKGCYPIMIHNSDVSYECSPHEKIRIMDPIALQSFKESVRDFANSITNKFGF